MAGFPGTLSIEDYNYMLPDDRIAKYPLEQRDGSKLLVYGQGKIQTAVFRDLPSLLDRGHHLVFNDTRVIQARFQFKKQSGAIIEILLLEPSQPSEYNLAFSSNSDCTWVCMVGNARKWKDEVLEKEISYRGKKTLLRVEKAGRDNNYFLCLFTWDNPGLVLSEIISSGGLTPLPPYLNREPEKSDSQRYQTVYSEYEGSVAAPTAGLHFTPGILKELEKKGISETLVTLHVGAGTFVPVKTTDARDHEMHTEHIYLNRKSIEDLYNSGKKIIAVGTTSVRTLESLYHISVKINNNRFKGSSLFLDQWEAYQEVHEISRQESLEIILAYMDQQNTGILKISTRIMIAPGYRFKMTDGIITNFHQPASTLLLLISAFIGKEWKRVYEYALENRFRFLSYGDSSLLLP